MFLRLTYSVLFVFAIASIARANGPDVVTQWTVGSGGNGDYFEVVDTNPNLTWTTAQAYATSLTYNGLHGHLATITSVGEDVFLTSLLGVNGGAWTDLTNDPTYGGTPTNSSTANGFVWADGEPLSYTNWAPNQPEYTIGNEHYVSLDSGGNWTANSNFSQPYILEFAPVPEPGPLGLLALGSLILLARFRRSRSARS
jgi:hypothetical protein